MITGLLVFLFSAKVSHDLQQIVKTDSTVTAMVSALVLTAIRRCDDVTISFLRRKVLNTGFTRQGNMDNRASARIEKLDRWIAAVCLGAIGYYEPAVFKFLLKLLFTRLKQLIPCTKLMTDFEQPRWVEISCVASVNYSGDSEPESNRANYDWQKAAVIRSEKLGRYLHNFCLTELTKFIEIHIIVKSMKENVSLRIKAVIMLSCVIICPCRFLCY